MYTEDPLSIVDGRADRSSFPRRLSRSFCYRGPSRSCLERETWRVTPLSGGTETFMGTLSRCPSAVIHVRRQQPRCPPRPRRPLGSLDTPALVSSRHHLPTNKAVRYIIYRYLHVATAVLLPPALCLRFHRPHPVSMPLRT